MRVGPHFNLVGSHKVDSVELDPDPEVLDVNSCTPEECESRLVESLSLLCGLE